MHQPDKTIQLQGLGSHTVKQMLSPFPAVMETLDAWKDIYRVNGDEIGKVLYKFLFGTADDYREDSTGSILRLRLNPTLERITVSQLLGKRPLEDEKLVDWVRDLPWEALLYTVWERQPDPRSAFIDWLGSADRVHLVRLPWRSRLTPEISPITGNLDYHPFGVLIAWSQQAGQIDLHPEEQLDSVIAGIEALQDSGVPLQISVLPNPTYQELCSAVATSDFPIYILHLIVHGIVGNDGIGRLLFTRDNALLEETGHALANALTEHYKTHHSMPAICLLNSCSSANGNGLVQTSSIAETIAEVGIPYVIANQAGITVNELSVFNEHFYTALGTGKAVHLAVGEARAALAHLQGDQECQRRTVPDTLKRPVPDGPPAVFIADRLPGWAVPALYMAEGFHGDLPAIPRWPRIIWPVDGKVMVLIEVDGLSFYIDECPVTVQQYDTPQRCDEPLDVHEARRIDDGFPKTNITGLEARAYAQQIGKQLPTFRQWCSIALLDTAYVNGLYQGDNVGQRGHIGKYNQRHTVRSSTLAAHCMGIWDYFGNTFEIVTVGENNESYVQVSSHGLSLEARAFNPDVRRILSVRNPNSWVGFRTVATLADVIRIANKLRTESRHPIHHFAE